MKKLFTLVSFVFLNVFSWAQIGPGAIAFLGFQGDGPDALQFVTIQEFSAGDSIFLTDGGWNGSSFFQNEGTMYWKAITTVAAGTVIKLQDPSDAGIANALVFGGGIASGKLTTLGISGDQLFAYVIDANGNQVPIAAFSTNAFIDVCDASGVGNTPRSCLPSNLSLGVNAMQLSANTPGTSNADNAYFNQLTVSGSADEILQIINNPLNWLENDDPATAGFPAWPNYSFTLQTSTPGIVSFENKSISLNEGAPPQVLKRNISPAVNLPKQITLQFALNASFTAADINTNPPDNNGSFTLTVPANTESISFAISSPADDGIEGNEFTNLSIVSADAGLIIGSPAIVDIEIIEDTGTSFISIEDVAAEVYSSEGQTLVMNLAISPVLSETSEISIEIVPESGFTLDDISTDPIELGGIINYTVQAGSSSLGLQINIIDDLTIEPTERFYVNIINYSGNFSPGALTSILVNIADNDIAPNYASLHINELIARPHNTFTDEAGEYDDWIELYNAGSSNINLSGLYMTNDPEIPNKFQFASGSPLTQLTPGSYKLIWADDSTEQSVLHTNFKLNDGGGFVGIYAQNVSSNGIFYSLIDSVSYPSMNVDHSLAAIPDGSNSYLVTAAPSPNSTNSPLSLNTIKKYTDFTYTNPVNERLEISFYHPESILACQILRLDGTEISTTKPQNSVHFVDTQNLASGLYIARIITKEGAECVRILVQH
ncbi:MAG: lamin tail domain-containing protein [Bacteroidia bacterium]